MDGPTPSWCSMVSVVMASAGFVMIVVSVTSRRSSSGGSAYSSSRLVTRVTSAGSCRHRGERFTATGRRRDRKSTRLNSSHLVISYAVFCLKKKKKNNKPPSRDYNMIHQIHAQLLLRSLDN